MRDAFGGTFMIEIMMVFVVLFVSFTAIIVSVAKTFRIKNEIINIVEQTNYKVGSSTDEIDNYIANAGYQIVDSSSLRDQCLNVDDSDKAYWGGAGYCIKSVGSHYKVTVYVSFSLPFFLDEPLTIPVSGETSSFVEIST